MAPRFLYLTLVAVLRLLARRRGGLDRDAEIVILRHELAVLRRTNPRPRRAHCSPPARGSSPPIGALGWW